MRIAMLTPTEDAQGVAEYAQRLIAGLEARGDCEVQSRSHRSRSGSPAKRICGRGNFATGRRLTPCISSTARSSGANLSRRENSGYWELRYALKKPVVLTAHTIASLEELLETSARRNPLFHLQKRLWLRGAAFRDSVEVAPFATALTLVSTPQGARDFDCAGREIGLRRCPARRGNAAPLSRPAQRL